MEIYTYQIKVYKIFWDDDPNFYIGSTKEKRLSNRMTAHRRDALAGKPCRVSQMIKKKGGCNYVQIASCMVANRDEQRIFEQHWIDTLRPTLNQKRAYTDMKAYKRKYMREYYHKRKEKEKQKQKEKEKEKKKVPRAEKLALLNRIYEEHNGNITNTELRRKARLGSRIVNEFTKSKR